MAGKVIAFRGASSPPVTYDKPASVTVLYSLVRGRRVLLPRATNDEPSKWTTWYDSLNPQSTRE